MESPSSRRGDSVMWKGPRTVLSVPSSAPFRVSTSMETPRTSESRTNSWRVSSHVWPTAVRKPIAASHSSIVGSMSRTKSWRWRVRLSMTCRSRWSLVARKLSTTASVAVSTVKSTWFS